MRLTSLYKNILESLNVQADELGLLTHHSFDGQRELLNVEVDGVVKRLTLPTDELLRKGLPAELVAFHPLSEVSNRGESEVFMRLKSLVSLRLTSSLMSVLIELAELAADKAKHAELSPKLHVLLEALPNADKKFVSALEDILGASVAGGRNRLINIYMKRGGTYMGSKRARVAVVSFPILEALDDPDRKPFGVAVRQKDVPQLKALFNMVLPNSDSVGAYNTYSDSLDAPNFEALMLAFAKVGSSINAVIKLASKYIEDASALKMDLKWVSELADIAELRHEIPPLEGNKGVPLKGMKADAAPDAMPIVQEQMRAAPSTKIINTEPVKRTQPPVVEDEAPASLFNTNFSSDQLKANLMAMNKNPLMPASTGYTATQPVEKIGPQPEPTYHSAGRKFSDLTGQPSGPAPYGQGYPGAAPNGHQAPYYGNQPPNGYGMATPAQQPNYGYGHQPVRQDPFAVMATAALRPPVNPGWGGGWGNGGWG